MLTIAVHNKTEQESVTKVLLGEIEILSSVKTQEQVRVVYQFALARLNSLYAYKMKLLGADPFLPVPVREIIDVNTRWEQGEEHDVRSLEIMDFLSAYDFKFCSDYFCWKTGGDGDNGETLMYELDEFFANKDRQETT